ncbi:MAG: TVP38/TMEM64 family protein [Deltaproteobacteria bacterium]|nr:TVP38/TMEM64 family protein [Deltaproteobacteria bacterium]
MKPKKKILLASAAALLALALAVVWGKQAAGLLAANLGSLTEWVEAQGKWGPIVFILGYVLAALIMIPGSLLTASAGFVFGLAKGTLVVAIASTLGACLAFVIGRYLARRVIEKKIATLPRFAAVDRAVGREGLKIVSLLRLSPVFPFSLLNYGLGLTGVRFRDYLVACLAMLPGSFLYVYYGVTAKNLADLAGGGAKGTGHWLFLGLGLAATVAVTAVITRLAKRALKEAVDV